MSQIRRILCHHMHTADGLMKVRGPGLDGKDVFDQIPIAEIFLHRPTYMVPPPAGFNPPSNKQSSVNAGTVVSVIVVAEETAAFSPLASESLHTSELAKYKQTEGWRGPK